MESECDAVWGATNVLFKNHLSQNEQNDNLPVKKFNRSTDQNNMGLIDKDTLFWSECIQY